MLFLLEVEVEHPPSGSMVKFLERVVQEWDAFQRLQDRGKILAGGKLSGRRGAAAILQVRGPEDADLLVASLPLFPHFTRISLTPLVDAEEARGNARRLLAVARRMQPDAPSESPSSQERG
ncbi:MAG: hypothetical protein DWQ01_21535 [Planctomycetota bacterium]|nr:MAG: hypothetical protein DWQ01_21535 [Planctomycetota bacterium]